MSIYIISNRPVGKDKKFSNDGKKSAQPNFRIADCKIDESNNTISYDLLEDRSDPDYEKINDVVKGIKSKDVLGGTELMFYDLYLSMKNDVKPNSDVLFYTWFFDNT